MENFLGMRARTCAGFALLALAYLVFSGNSSQVLAADSKPVDDWVGKNNFGGTGLFQTRSARSSPDGNFEVG